ncbi:molybdopterin converting factor subunit 1 [Caldimonas taiwanensis]|uniref:molybdopterin converting factor subunit 1 n=1 Tax=Caldimonas taiwanensis TaxID=307483 RepID=UPI0007839592|nr:molybdopterin converting factor subunit 1 [Caldimonas taiwanensis]
MRITVKYFASVREALGPQESIEVPEGSTVGSLRVLLQSRSSAHAEVLASGRVLRAALDQALCDESARLRDGVEVAFFPPVTGG